MSFVPIDVEPFIPSRDPWLVPDLTQAELRAFKNLAAGNANEHQQRLALAVIVRKFGGWADMSFRPGEDGDRATCFAEGRRYVASRVIEAINRPLKPEGEQHGGPGSTEQGRRHPARRRAKPAEG